jgi:predicted metal-dependent hydrolase
MEYTFINMAILPVDLPRLRRRAGPHRQAVAAARRTVETQLAKLNSHYTFRFVRVSIRSQRTRWGSASSRGTLSFNYRIIYLPPELQDLIIVHELCHLKEMNHSPAFWALVAQTIPNWKKLRRELRRYRL